VKVSSWVQLGVVLTSLSLLAGCTGQGTAQNSGALQDQITQLKTDNQTLKEQQAALETKVAQQVEQLKAQIDALSSGGGTSGASAGNFRIAFVSAEDVFVKYKGTETAMQRYRQEKEDKEKELSNLQDQFSAGAMSQNDYASKRTALETELNNLDQQLTTDITKKILDVAQQLGKELGYDLVVARQNVVLYYKKGGVVDDLTDQVLSKMNEELNTSPEAPATP